MYSLLVILIISFYVVVETVPCKFKAVKVNIEVIRTSIVIDFPSNLPKYCIHAGITKMHGIHRDDLNCIKVN